MSIANLEIIDTGDGSPTLLHKSFGETYHSKNGANTESRHVFIEAGLKYCMSERHELDILELGFGTGLNALLTWQFARQHEHICINYTAIEGYPVPSEIYRQLHYLDGETSNLHWLHESDWARWHCPTPSFSFRKEQILFENLDFTAQFDLVYFDVFAPQYQPEFWEPPFLSKVSKSLRTNGTLVTYGAKGSFQRALTSCGFEVEKLPGPPGKREMVRATKKR